MAELPNLYIEERKSIRMAMNLNKHIKIIVTNVPHVSHVTLTSSLNRDENKYDTALKFKA